MAGRRGRENGKRQRTGYCPPHEQHVSTAAAVPDHQIKWANHLFRKPLLILLRTLIVFPALSSKLLLWSCCNLCRVWSSNSLTNEAIVKCHKCHASMCCKTGITGVNNFNEKKKNSSPSLSVCVIVMCGTTKSHQSDSSAPWLIFHKFLQFHWRDEHHSTTR